jgi:hypothetical protein
LLDLGKSLLPSTSVLVTDPFFVPKFLKILIDCMAPLKA